MADAVYKWARGLPEETVKQLKEAGLYRPEGPGISEVEPGVWSHPRYFLKKPKDDDGTHRESGDDARSA